MHLVELSSVSIPDINERSTSGPYNKSLCKIFKPDHRPKQQIGFGLVSCNLLSQ